MLSPLDVAVFTVPVAAALALSYWFRHRGPGTHVLIWFAGLPAMFALTAVLTLLISFQVFGVDLLD